MSERGNEWEMSAQLDQRGFAQRRVRGLEPRHRKGPSQCENSAFTPSPEEPHTQPFWSGMLRGLTASGRRDAGLPFQGVPPP